MSRLNGIVCCLLKTQTSYSPGEVPLFNTQFTAGQSLPYPLLPVINQKPMREHKYRAILKNEKTPREIYGINFNEKTALVLISGCEEWIAYKQLIEFTGLKDKNGVEIYEGDIYDYKGEIGTFESIEDFYFDELIEYRVARGEIIGNIYENPELLNKKK